MKNIYIILALIQILYVSAQNSYTNPLNENDFYNIKFNNVTLSSIEETNASVTEMQVLFGNTTLNTAVNETSPSLARDFWNNDIIIGFQDDTDTGDEFYILYIRIDNENIAVNVKGITARIGDHVSIFGNNFIINNRPSGSNTPTPDYSSYRISFADERFGNSVLSFEIDKTTDRIIEIQFNTF